MYLVKSDVICIATAVWNLCKETILHVLIGHMLSGKSATLSYVSLVIVCCTVNVMGGGI